MKQLLVLTLAFALTGCASIAPASPTPFPTATPQIIIQTVLVTVIVTLPPTQTATATPSPTLTPIPTLTPQAATKTPSGSATATAGTTTPTLQATSPITSPTATLPANAGGGIFTNLSRSTDHFALRCQPDTVTFGLSTTDSAVTEVDLFYRMEDASSGAISGWVDIGKMTSDQKGNFTYDFAASLIDPDLRTHNAWFDYQFIGLNRLGVVVGRSARILKQISYTVDCPA